MRLSFGNGERADFVLDDGVVNLGSAVGNGVVLTDRDVAPWHARVVVDARGIVLEIMDPNARTHVNARPVREKALLRCGDMLCLGRTAITIKADSDATITTAIPDAAMTPPAPAMPPRAIRARTRYRPSTSRPMSGSAIWLGVTGRVYERSRRQPGNGAPFIPKPLAG